LRVDIAIELTFRLACSPFYEVPGFGAVRWRVQKTTIKAPQGNVVQTVG